MSVLYVVEYQQTICRLFYSSTIDPSEFRVTRVIFFAPSPRYAYSIAHSGDGHDCPSTAVMVFGSSAPSTAVVVVDTHIAIRRTLVSLYALPKSHRAATQQRSPIENEPVVVFRTFIRLHMHRCSLFTAPVEGLSMAGARTQP